MCSPNEHGQQAARLSCGRPSPSDGARQLTQVVQAAARPGPGSVYRRRIALALGAAALAAAFLAPRALAHATLLRSEPADNAALARPPRAVHLLFSEAISPRFIAAEVLDVRGGKVKPIRIRADRSGHGLTLTLPKLPKGVYSVDWRVVSEDDGHVTRGLVVFTVGKSVSPRAVRGAAPKPAPAPLEVVLRWINFGALAGILGALALASLVLIPAGRAQSSEWAKTRLLSARRRVLALAILSGGLALAAGVGQLLWQARSLRAGLPQGDSFQSVTWEVLSGTRWGMLWLARQGILLLLVAATLLLRHEAQVGKRARWSRVAWPAAGALALGLTVVQARTGHAASLRPAPLALAVAALHILSAGLWVGGLLALVVGLWPPLRWRHDAAAVVRDCLRRFSALAALSVGLLVATGLFYAGRQVASPDALVTTLYGKTLLAKTALVAAAGSFGLLNSISLHPRLASPLARLLRRPSGWTPIQLRRLPSLVLAEAGLGLLIFGAVAVMTASPPANGPEFAPSPGPAPTEASRSADDVLVALEVKPNRPGENVFSVTAVSTRRPPPAPFERVLLRFTPSGGGRQISVPMAEIEPGRYRLGGSYLSLAGSWRIDVAIRRRGLEDSVAGFDWRVAVPGPGHRVLVSDRPLAPLLTRAAGVALALILAVLGLVWPATRYLRSRNGWSHGTESLREA